MKTPICDLLGIEFPLLAFSHCRDVVAAVTNAGGFGVLGASSHSPAELEQELSWIDDHVGGKPYGVDIVCPEKFEGKGLDLTPEQVTAMVPAEHRDYVDQAAGRAWREPGRDRTRGLHDVSGAVRGASASNCSRCRSAIPSS